MKNVTTAMLYTPLTLLLICNSAHADINGVSWLQGTWTSQQSEGQIEERWSSPLAGTLMATVRMTTSNTLNMVEMIIIEERDNSLELRFQQFSPALEPRSGVEYLQLVSSGERTVAFAAPDQSKKEGLLGITYTRSDDDILTIDVRLAGGITFSPQLQLQNE